MTVYEYRVDEKSVSEISYFYLSFGDILMLRFIPDPELEKGK